MTEKKRARIIHSKALAECGLAELAGQDCDIVDRVVSNGKQKGCWVRLDGRFLGEFEWFVPDSALVVT